MRHFYTTSFVLISVMLLLISLSIGVYEGVDTSGYFFLGKQLSTKTYIELINDPAVWTLFGPVYGLVLYQISQSGLQGNFIITFLHVGCFLGSSVLMYLMGRKLYPQVTVLITYMYILMPFNLIYTTLLLPETLSQLFVTLFLFLLFLSSSSAYKTKWYLEPFFVLISVLLTLTKYVFAPLVLYSFCRLVFEVVKKSRFVKTNYSSVINVVCLMFSFLPVLIGTYLLFWWVRFNYEKYGIYSLSVVSGRHLYNSVVAEAHLLPSQTNPSFYIFTSRVPESEIHKPWWENQHFFENLSESEKDNLYFNFSIAAIREHPWLYLYDVFKGMYLLAIKAPYIPDTYNAAVNNCSNSCQAGLITSLCTPPLNICSARRVWSAYVKLTNNFYPFGASILFSIVIIGIISSLFLGNHFEIRTAGLFLFLLMLISASEWSDGRYLIPLYPFYLLLAGSGLQNLWKIMKKLLSTV